MLEILDMIYGVWADMLCPSSELDFVDSEPVLLKKESVEAISPLLEAA